MELQLSWNSFLHCGWPRILHKPWRSSQHLQSPIRSAQCRSAGEKKDFISLFHPNCVAILKRIVPADVLHVTIMEFAFEVHFCTPKVIPNQS